MRGKRVPMDFEILERSWKGEEEKAEEPQEPEVAPVSPLRRRRRRDRYLDDERSQLVVAEGTEVIREGAYKDRTDLVSVELPETLRYIGKSAFEGCTALESVVFPEGLKLIDDKAFSGCRSLTKIVIPGSVERVGAFAFCQCASLEELKIMNGVRQLGRWAFADCMNLRSFHKRDLPRSVDKMMQLVDCRVVQTWAEAFHGSPCAETREDRRRRRAMERWKASMTPVQRIL